MELYNEYLVLKSMGYGLYLVEIVNFAYSRMISSMEMRSKILATGLNIKEIIMDLSAGNYAVIMTVGGIPTCNMEKRMISAVELAYLDEATQIASQEFLDRAKLVKTAFDSV